MKARKKYSVPGLTRMDLINLEVALRLRVESAKEHKERKEHLSWRRTYVKVYKVYRNLK